MYKHVAKRLKRSNDAPLAPAVDDPSSAGSSSSDSEASSAASGDDSDASDDSQESASGERSGDDGADLLENPLEGRPPNQRCLLCPLKHFRKDADAKIHLASNDHQRRKKRVEAFLASDEGKILAVNYDLEGVVALLDERAEAKRPARPKAKAEAKYKRPGKRQRAQLRAEA